MYYFNLSCAMVSDQIPSLKCHIFDKHWLPIFRYPHQVQVDGKNTMATMTILAHGLSLNRKAKAAS